LTVADAGQSLAMIRAVLNNTAGPPRDIVMLNAGAAIYASGIAPSLAAGVEQAGAVLQSGKANETLEALVRISNAF